MQPLSLLVSIECGRYYIVPGRRLTNVSKALVVLDALPSSSLGLLWLFLLLNFGRLSPYFAGASQRAMDLTCNKVHQPTSGTFSKAYHQEHKLYTQGGIPYP